VAKPPRRGPRFRNQVLRGNCAATIPTFIEALQILGDAYTKNGPMGKGTPNRRAAGQALSRQLARFYNLACSYSLLKHVEEAFAALRQAVKLGYSDTRWLTKDPDLDNLRQDNRFGKNSERLSKKPNHS